MSSKVKAVCLIGFVYLLGVSSGFLVQSYRFLHHLPGPFVERRINHLSRELNLTLQQEQALREVFRIADERAREVNEEVSWDLEDIHHDSVQAIEKILTPDQQKQFEHIHRRMHHRRHTPMEVSPGPLAVTTGTVHPS